MSAQTIETYINEPQFRPHYVDPRSSTMTLYVPDAHCAKCVGKIESGLPQVDGVESARMDLSRKLLTVAIQPNADIAPVLGRLRQLGFSYQPLKVAELKEQSRNLRRQDFLRLGVAGAMAGNIMIFAVAQYAGADKTQFDLGFGWISFGLFLPVLAYSAWPFYQTFWTKLKARRLSIESSVVMALAIGTVYSLWNLIRGHGEVFFDSLSALIFLLLAARLWQGKLIERVNLSLQHVPFLKIDAVAVWNDEKQTYQLEPVENLRVGQTILLKAGQRLPADARLKEERVSIQQAVWSGEAHPVDFVQDQLVYAGSTLVSDQATFTVAAVGEQSRLGRLFSDLQKVRRQSTPVTTDIDRIGQVFVILVAASAVLSVIIFWSIDPLMALQRSLALSLLACPCALAIAIPLLNGLAIQRAQELGLVVKSADIFEKVRRIRHVVFDKTGTVTMGEPTVQSVYPARLEPQTAAIVQKIESQSHHPYAQALARYYADSVENFQVEHIQVGPRSAQGVLHGETYLLKSSTPPLEATEFSQELSWVGLWRNEKQIAWFGLSDPLRPEARSLMRVLTRDGIQTHLLSGDNSNTTSRVAHQLEISDSQVRAECLPEDKANYIQNLSHCMMVGDGANDTLAMARAQVAVAVSGGMESSLKACDVYMSQPELHTLLKLRDLARHTRYWSWIMLGVSLIYNLSGATLAILGYIHPLIAAVLMPVSSLSLVLIVLFAMRRKGNP